MHLLRRPRLALLFAGGALNEIGSWATLIALWGFSSYHFHAGPGAIAEIGVAWTVPPAALSVVSGWPIDRFGPRPTLAAANLAGVATALAMAAAGSFGALAALAAAAGAVRAFGEPAAASLPPRLVGDADLLAANSLMSMTQQLAIVCGPLVAALSITLWGLRAAFLVDAATFVAGTAALAPLRLRPVDGDAHTSHAGDVLAGVVLAWRNVAVRRTLALALAVFSSWGCFMVLEPLYVRDVLHRSPAVLGYLQTSYGVGLLVTTAALPRIGDRVASLRVLAASVAVSGLAAALYVGTSRLAVAVAGVFLWGVATGFFMPPMRTLLQRSTPAGSHGRVMATVGAVNGLAGLATIPVSGIVVGVVGVKATGAAVGACLLACGTAGLAARRPAVQDPPANSASSAAATAG